MKGDPVPKRDHVSRYCSGMRCTEERQVTGAAFLPREEEKYLSVNWLEFLNLDNRQEEIREVRKVLSSKLRLGAMANIAVLNVGEALDYVHMQSPDSRELSVLHEPEEEDPSHSGISGFRHNDHLIADLIAEVIQETCPVKGLK